MDNWMDNNVESDIQTAIASQTIQTALEKNTAAKDDPLYGYPKACKLALTSGGQGAPLAATYTPLLFDNTARFNYGGYSYRTNGVYYDGIYVPETGIYSVVGQVGFIANSQMAALFFFVNGGVTAPDGTVTQADSGATLSNGTFYVTPEFNFVGLLRAGDLIQSMMYQATAPTATAAAYQWIYVEKREGRL